MDPTERNSLVIPSLPTTGRGTGWSGGKLEGRRREEEGKIDTTCTCMGVKMREIYYATEWRIK